MNETQVYFDYKGWRFTAPFICMGCGVEVSARQWAFSRSCGPCDVSPFRTRRLLFRQCFAGPRTKLPTHGAHPNDIPEENFVDPEKRLEYPLMCKKKSQKMETLGLEGR